MDVSTAREKLRITRIDPLVEGERWDEFVRRHPRATIFHTSAWMRVLWETYRFRPFYFADSGNSTVSVPSILTLAEVDSWLTGRRGISLPFADACPFLGSTGAEFQDIWTLALEAGRERGWRTLEVRHCDEGCGYPPSLQFYNHTLSLAGGPSTIFDLFDSSVRRAIRKAEKLGVHIEIERSESAMKVYYELHCLTRKKHGLPPQSYLFFRNIYREIIKPGLGFVAVGRASGKPIAGAVFFQFCKKAIYKFGASDPLAETLRPNNLVMWKAISEICAAGCRSLDLGRTSLENSGLRRYKRSWGAIESVTRYVKWNFAKGAFVEDRDEAVGLHTPIFRLLPRSVSRLLGKLLYPHIA